MYDVIILGAGVSGLSAAVYCGRFNLKTIVIGESGGAIALSSEVTNFPGYESIPGIELADRIKKHALAYGAELIEGKADKIEKDGKFLKVFFGKKSYEAKAAIVATGTDWRKLNVPGEKQYTNKGVHYCALCDGALYKNKVISVVGGSDSAAKEALMLSQFGKKVYIIYRGDKIRADPKNCSLIEANKKVEIIIKTNVVGIKGEKFVKSVVLDRPYKGSTYLMLDAIFVDIGREPVSHIVRDIGVNVNEKNEIMVDSDGKTNVKGVFACGDVINSRFKQAVTAVAQGVVAAYSAYQYISDEVPMIGSNSD
ncbi:MAG TPA: NAD(P)/FAD-dependent oxidoreductase [Candidatus Nanoarchaeia archaeon]|nr:NAD(P)/FAD-dependent oxidoreductase [Candidatus Nanoarchaeia archaeon]